MKKDKKFAVQSDNKNLIVAFKQECFSRKIDFLLSGKTLIIFRYTEDRNKYEKNISNNLGENLHIPTPYTLPEQWNQAIEALDSITQPEYEVNDWVIYKGKVWKIFRMPKSNTNENIASFIRYVGGETLCIDIDHIERHATQEEIKQHLLSLTDIEKGDEVKWSEQNNRTFDVQEIMLYSEIMEEPSPVSHRYYLNNGDHLVMIDAGNCLPLDQCEKVDDLSIKTASGNIYQPKFENNPPFIKYGCIKVDIDKLKSLKDIMSFCEINDIDLHINSDGEINDFEVMDEEEGEEVINNIDLYDINKLIEKLK